MSGTSRLSSITRGSGTDVVWRGHPTVMPAFIGSAILAIVGAITLSWFEVAFGLAFLGIASIPLLAFTYLAIFFLWLAAALKLAVTRASSTYTLRRSSLEIEQGLAGKKIFTMSAAGFSDLEVMRSVWGRILNIGNIMLEVDSGRDLTLKRVRDPMKVSAMIREVMTMPMVRIAPQEPVLVEGGTERKNR